LCLQRIGELLVGVGKHPNSVYSADAGGEADIRGEADVTVRTREVLV
jgi:hypothetical protein